MRRSVCTFLLASLLGLFFLASPIGAASASAQESNPEFDAQFPPGNPVLGDDRPGDIDAGGETNYALWGLVAVCLIGAGVLLIKVEQWEARRIEHQSPSTTV